MPFALASLILGTLTEVSHAQSTPSAIDQLNSNLQNRNLDKQARGAGSLTNSAPELYPGESDDVGPQSILATKPRPLLFDVSADAQYYFSDNALLDHDSRQSSGILISTIQAAFAPQAYSILGGQASPRIGVRQQWYNFLEYKTEAPNLNSYDFITQTFFVDEHWTKNGWTLGGGMDATRLTSMQGNKQFYGEFQPRWEVSKLFEVTRKANLVLSYQGNIHFSHTPFPVELGPPLQIIMTAWNLWGSYPSLSTPVNTRSFSLTTHFATPAIRLNKIARTSSIPWACRFIGLRTITSRCALLSVLTNAFQT